MKIIRRLSLGALLCLAPVARSAPAASPPAPRFFRTIYLVRHGDRYAEQPGDENVVDGLTPLGIAQARLAAARLRGMPVVFTSLTASPMTRARQTAEVIQESLPDLRLKLTPLLRECTPRAWRTTATKGEKPGDVDPAEAQLDRAFATYFVPAQGREANDILVCHANVIRYFVMKALGADPKAGPVLSLAHCSLTIIRIGPRGGFNVLAVGDAGHIPPNLQSRVAETTSELLTPPDP